MERIWFDQGRENFFAIPDEIKIPSGDYVLRGFGGRTHRVDVDAVEPWRITREQAAARVNARVEKAWGGLRGAVDRMFLLGQTAARQAGVEVPKTDGRSPLPEKLSAVLGMEPGEMLTDPDQVRQRLRDAAARFGVHIKDVTDAPEEETPPPGFRDVEEVDAEEVIEEPEPAEETDASAPDEPDPIREFLNRPEVNEAVKGFGRALSQLGRRLQEASNPIDRSSSKREE
ncbi:MAG: hypothetical protein AAFV53_23880 [Myxococcota bacterium]